MAKLLAIVPARSGSRGLIGKNMRLVAGRPLIAHTLDAVRNSQRAERIILSSDGEQIRAWAELNGYETVERPASLAGPDVTIAEMARALADDLDWEGIVGVFQPTSPLRGAEDVSAAIDLMLDRGVRSVSSSVREPHLYWREDAGGESVTPIFEERVNRQRLDSRVLRETGAIQLVKSEFLRSTGGMVAPDHVLFETGADAAIDIDDFDDLASVRARAERGTVVFRIRGESATGSGHLNHCLQLAEELADQELRFLIKDGAADYVGTTLEQIGYDWEVETDLEGCLAPLAGGRPAVLVNDVLDTDIEDVLVPKSLGYIVVNIEDLGAGARYADWVVNALYPPGDDSRANVSSGARWATVRHEFHGLPRHEVTEEPKRVLITFGGTDPSRLSARFATTLATADLGVDLRLVIGPGVEGIEDIPGVSVRRSVRSMAAEMATADLVVTSAGRTVYEAALCGTPVVAVAQNAREATHAHLGSPTGVIYLGIGALLDEDELVRTVRRLLENAPLRRELGDRLRASIDERGAERIGHAIRGLMRGLG